MQPDVKTTHQANFRRRQYAALATSVCFLGSAITLTALKHGVLPPQHASLVAPILLGLATGALCGCVVIFRTFSRR